MENDGTPDRPNLRVFEDLPALSRAVAEQLTEEIRSRAGEVGGFSLFLSGGSTPRGLYRLLAGEYGERIPWERAQLFWGDERFVPPDHPDSNYRMARELLIDSVPIPSDNVHPIPTREDTVEDAARAYERTLRDHFNPSGRAGRKDSALSPDCILLGVGSDGHTASLFPGDSALHEKQRWIRAVEGPAAATDHPRITVTLPFIRRVARGYFLVSGAGKKRVLGEIFRSRSTDSNRVPAARVETREEPLWFIDRAADPFHEKRR